MEDVRQIFSRLDGEISRRGSKHCDMVRERLYGLTLSGTLCAVDIQGVTPVVFTRWSNIPAVDSVWGPCATDVRFFMDKYFGAQGGDWSSVKVERAVHHCFC